MSTEYRYTFAAWAEAFGIFAKYDGGLAEVAAEHDIIYAGPDPKVVSGEDMARLTLLGWHVDIDSRCFYQYV